VSQVALERPRIGPFIRENVAGRMSEHVGMDLKGYLCLDAGALDKLLQARHGERRAALANEDER
jgi:hypothetical protein